MNMTIIFDIVRHLVFLSKSFGDQMFPSSVVRKGRFLLTWAHQKKLPIITGHSSEQD
jgi:hypothetical protein